MSRKFFVIDFRLLCLTTAAVAPLLFAGTAQAQKVSTAPSNVLAELGLESLGSSGEFQNRRRNCRVFVGRLRCNVNVRIQIGLQTCQQRPWCNEVRVIGPCQPRVVTVSCSPQPSPGPVPSPSPGPIDPSPQPSPGPI
jgi:hypothetical protein